MVGEGNRIQVNIIFLKNRLERLYRYFELYFTLHMSAELYI